MQCKFPEASKFFELSTLSTFSQYCHVSKKSNPVFNSLIRVHEINFLLDFSSSEEFEL